MLGLTSIMRLLEQGKVSEARTALAGLQRKDPEVVRLQRMVRNLILRKFQRQAKVAEFVAEAGNDPHLQVAVGRLAGTLGSLSQAPDAEFAGLLATLAAGDLRAGFARLRRVPDGAGLALGWTAVLRGDLAQAAASFAAVPAAQARRAACGLAVVAALRGDAAAVERQVAGLGPFPHTAFPALSKLLQGVSRQHGEHGPAKLAELLRSTNFAVLQRAYDSWPKTQPEARAWLALRLGDLRGIASDSGDQRAVESWREAARAHPGLQADVLKRLLLAYPVFKAPLPGTWRLYDQLRQRDAAVARRVVDVVTAAWPGAWCLAHLEESLAELKQPRIDQLPVELLLLHFRAIAVVMAQEQLTAAPRMKQLRPLLERCDAAYPGNLIWLRAKLTALGQAGQFNERRKTCLAALVADPTCAPEILPLYLANARRDGRVTRQVGEELTRLAGIIGDDVDLAVLGVEIGKLTEADVHAQWPEPVALAILVAGSKAQPGALPVLGQDETIDILACMAADRLKKSQLDRLLQHQDRLHRLLRRHQRRLVVRAGPLVQVLRRWRAQQPRDWRPWYHLGACARLSGHYETTERAWDRALDMIPQELAEAQEMSGWMDANEGFGHGSFEGSPDMLFEDFFADALEELHPAPARELAQAFGSPFGPWFKGSPGTRRSSRRKATGAAPKMQVKPPAPPIHPLLLAGSAANDFLNLHGAAMDQRLRELIPTLGLATTGDAAALADGIPPAERAAVLDWLHLLSQHNNSLHDLTTASAIAVMSLRLERLLKQ